MLEKSHQYYRIDPQINNDNNHTNINENRNNSMKKFNVSLLQQIYMRAQITT